MFEVKLENFHLLEDATSLLALIGTDADLKFTPSEFAIVAAASPSHSHSQTHHFSGFIATLQLTNQFFTNYSVHRNHNATISIQSFHQALMDGSNFSLLTIHLEEHILSLTFNDTAANLEGLPISWYQELRLIPSQGEDLGQFDRDKCFIIHSSDLRRVILESSSVFHDFVSITLTDSQVKFTIASKEIIFTKEAGQCLILAPRGEVETQFRIVLDPLSFFVKLTNKGNWIWFFKTNDSRTVISVPLHDWNAQYVVYFPQI